MFAGSIYGVRRPTDGEFRYVGQTIATVAHRRMTHFKALRRGRKTPFYDWLRTFESPDDVYFQPIEVVIGGHDELQAAERRWIAELRAQGHRLLNLTDGGDGVRGFVWTAEQRKAAGDRARGRTSGPRLRGPDSPTWGRRIHSDEQKAKWSAARKGSITGDRNPNYGKFGPEHPAFGRKFSAETLALLSEQKRGALNPNYGKTNSPESNAKRSDAMRGIARPWAVRSAHTRRHTNKNIFKDSCRHCVEDRQNQTDQGSEAP